MVPALLRSSPIPIPQASGTSALTLIVFTLPLVFIVTLLCGLLPSWLILRRNTSANLQSGHAVGASSSDARIGRILLVSQTAVTVLLLSAASLLLAVFLRLRSTPSGVQPQHLTVAQVNLKGGDYSSVAQTMQFIDKVSERLRHYPGVQHVGAVNGFPLDRGLNIIMGPPGKQGNSYIVELRLVTPGYFKAMGIPLLAGRDVAESDKEDSPPVVILSQAMVNKLGLGQSAVGEHPDGIWVKKTEKRKVTVIGVVGDSHTHSLAEAPALLIYEPFTQQPDDAMKRMNGWFRTSFAIRSAADTDLAAAVQKAIHDADPGIPISRYTTMQTIIDHSLARPRFFSSLVMAFAGFALALTVIGLFGLLSYQVTQRTREIGVRIALGATRGNVLGLILRRGLVLTVIGLAMGSVASLMLPRLIHSIMSDIITGGSGIAMGLLSTLPALTMACGAMLIAAVLASYLPARRASAIEPMEALRTE
jgi:predicted permease